MDEGMLGLMYRGVGAGTVAPGVLGRDIVLAASIWRTGPWFLVAVASSHSVSGGGDGCRYVEVEFSFCQVMVSRRSLRTIFTLIILGFILPAFLVSCILCFSYSVLRFAKIIFVYGNTLVQLGGNFYRIRTY